MQGIRHKLFPPPKKDDLSLVTNYRGISLMAIAVKLYNKMILNRLFFSSSHYYEKTKMVSKCSLNIEPNFMPPQDN